MTLKEQVLEFVSQVGEATLKQFLQLLEDIQKPQPKSFTRFSGIFKDHSDILMEVEQEINENRADNLMTIRDDE